MSKPVVYFDCDVCGSQYQMSAGKYEGHKCSGYDIFVCHPCYSMNWDGWGPMIEPRILGILATKSIPEPPRNSKGWLPREF